MAVYFRADGDGEIGLGHLYRSCAVAGILGEDCFFVTRRALPQLRPIMLKYCKEIIELGTFQSSDEEATAFANRLKPGDIAVLDGYHFDEAYQARVKSVHGCSLVCIDDIAATRFVADAVINHAGGFSSADYQAPFYTEYYLGPKYALLRSEFFSAKSAKAGSRKNLLICLGGADPDNHTLDVLKVATTKNFDQIHVLLGAAYAHKTVLDAFASAHHMGIALHENLDVDGVVQLMSTCGYAVLAPSSVSYEYMTLGGVLFLYQIADNQSRIRAYCLQEGLAKDFSELNILSEVDEKTMIENQARVFDGRSPERLRKIFQSLRSGRKLGIRRSTLADEQLTFRWANDSVARQMSFSSDPISPEQHASWFARRLQYGTCFYYILELDGSPAGQIRFDKKGDATYVLSYSLDADWRGQGLGPKVLTEGMKQFQADLGESTTIIGYVRHANIASCQSFEHLGFRREETTDYPESYKYVISI